jgi:hypothetical protein
MERKTFIDLINDDDFDDHGSSSEDYEDDNEDDSKQIVEVAKERPFSDQKISRDDSHVGTFSKSPDS